MQHPQKTTRTEKYKQTKTTDGETEGLVLRMLMENNEATSNNKVKPQRIGV